MCGNAQPHLIGCQQRIPDRQPVSGIVTLDGRPVPNAAVTFVSEVVFGRASGLTDESGRYELTTLEPRDGAITGSYRVAITDWSERIAVYEELTIEERPCYDPYPSVQNKKPGDPSTEKKAGSSLLPSRYADVTKSGLAAIVVRGDNTINFALNAEP